MTVVLYMQRYSLVNTNHRLPACGDNTLSVQACICSAAAADHITQGRRQWRWLPFARLPHLLDYIVTSPTCDFNYCNTRLEDAYRSAFRLSSASSVSCVLSRYQCCTRALACRPAFCDNVGLCARISHHHHHRLRALDRTLRSPVPLHHQLAPLQVCSCYHMRHLVLHMLTMSWHRTIAIEPHCCSRLVHFPGKLVALSPLTRNTAHTIN